MDSWKPTFPLWSPRLLAESDTGAVATTCVAPFYAGPVLLALDGRAPCSLLLSSASEAEAVASYAISHLGGYLAAHLVPAPGARAVLLSWREWAYGDAPASIVQRELPHCEQAPLALLTGRASVQA